MKRKLVVYLQDNEVGILEQDKNGLLWFHYASAWLANPTAIPLSCSLPLRNEPLIGNAARPFFAGILPEDGIRQQVAENLGISQRNDFALLERIGGECAGAVSLHADGAPPPSRSKDAARKLTQKQLEAIIAELPERPLLAGEANIRLSLAGAQTKLPVILKGKSISLPLGNTPSTHIIKPEPDRFPGLAANELFCMQLAKSLELNVANVSYQLIGDKKCLIVERFDRRLHQDGSVTRVHQEDFCQAIGLPPERKYQQEGGPLLRDCFELLNEWSPVPALDVLAFLDALIFNVLIGNADAHGKNFSLLYEGGQRRLAPLYDLVCILAWSQLSKTPAMKIGRCDSIETICGKHWQKMAVECKLGWPGTRRRIMDLSRRTLSAIGSDHLRELAQQDQAVASVAAIVERRAKGFIREFEE